MRCDPDAFQVAFGAPISNLDALVQANTVTITRLVDILPEGTVDPTPCLYNPALYVCAACLGAGVLFNSAIQPISAKDQRS